MRCHATECCMAARLAACDTTAAKPPTLNMAARPSTPLRSYTASREYSAARTSRLAGPDGRRSRRTHTPPRKPRPRPSTPPSSPSPSSAAAAALQSSSPPLREGGGVTLAAPRAGNDLELEPLAPTFAAQARQREEAEPEPELPPPAVEWAGLASAAPTEVSGGGESMVTGAVGTQGGLRPLGTAGALVARQQQQQQQPRRWFGRSDAASATAGGVGCPPCQQRCAGRRWCCGRREKSRRIPSLSSRHGRWFAGRDSLRVRYWVGGSVCM
jgi:hypothetical protein